MGVAVTPGAESMLAGMGPGGAILLVLLCLVSMAFLAPLFLQIAVWLVTKQKPKYKEIFFTNLKLIGANVGGSFVLGLLFGFAGALLSINVNSVRAVALLASLPLMAHFYGYFIKLPETGRIGIGKGALVMLAQFLLGFGVIILGLFLAFLSAVGR